MTPENRHDWKIQRLEQRCRGDEDPPADVLLDLAEAYFQKGYYFARGDEFFRRASEAAQRAVDRHGGSARAWNVLANASYGLSDLDASERHYTRAIEADPKDALAHVGLGNLHKQRGNPSRAVDAFARAAELDPDLWQAHYNLGGALYAEARERDFRGADEPMERAIYHLVTALRLRPFESFLGNIYKDLGELFLHTRQYKYARRFFTRLVQHADYGGLAHYYLGLTHFSMGRYHNAIHHYREFLKSEPESALAWSKIGLAHLELGEWEQAREACEYALVLEPANTLARFSLGCIDVDQRLFSRAEERFESILAETPDYFPAWVELVKTHYVRGDFGWLFEQLRREIKGFETDEAFDGGRQFYKGGRGQSRRRVDVVLAQIQEMGIDAFSSLAAIVEEVRTDSLRFQLWEQLYELARRNRVEQVLSQLDDAATHFGQRLGRTVLLLSQYVPEEAILDAFFVDEEALRRRAQQRKGPGDDLVAYMAAVDEVRGELREFQAYLLLALAVKGTPSAEDFLADHLDSEDRELRASASISLVFYGNERAVRLLREEADGLEDPHRERLLELVELGVQRSEQQEKVIELRQRPEGGTGKALAAPPPRAGRPPAVGSLSAPTAPPRGGLRAAARESCALCARGRDEVDRLLSGNRVYVCNLCVSWLHQHRDESRVPDREEHVCSFCNASIFEVQGMHQAQDLLFCNRCLDACVGVLAKEEVERFLRGFQ